MDALFLSMNSIENPSIAALLFLLIIWSLVWKGLALWKSARVGSKKWFIVLLVLNTAGLLEILYIFYFSKKPKVQPTTS